MDEWGTITYLHSEGDEVGAQCAMGRRVRASHCMQDAQRHLQRLVRRLMDIVLVQRRHSLTSAGLWAGRQAIEDNLYQRSGRKNSTKAIDCLGVVIPDKAHNKRPAQGSAERLGSRSCCDQRRWASLGPFSPGSCSFEGAGYTSAALYPKNTTIKWGQRSSGPSTFAEQKVTDERMGQPSRGEASEFPEARKKPCEASRFLGSLSVLQHGHALHASGRTSPSSHASSKTDQFRKEITWTLGCSCRSKAPCPLHIFIHLRDAIEAALSSSLWTLTFSQGKPFIDVAGLKAR